jgi:hypothetical protein
LWIGSAASSHVSIRVGDVEIMQSPLLYHWRLKQHDGRLPYSITDFVEVVDEHMHTGRPRFGLVDIQMQHGVRLHDDRTARRFIDALKTKSERVPVEPKRPIEIGNVDTGRDSTELSHYDPRSNVHNRRRLAAAKMTRRRNGRTDQKSRTPGPPADTLF